MDEIQHLIKVFHGMGIFYYLEEQRRFFTTPLVRLFFSDDPAAAEKLAQEFAKHNPDHYDDGIIVQSNFKVYAHTNSALTLGLMSKFCVVTHGYPGRYVGNITRDRVVDALQNGVRGQQMLRFLEANAHPSMIQKGAVKIPENVRTQILVWEKDRHRLTFTRVIDFTWVSPVEKEKAVTKLRAREADLKTNVIVWQHETKPSVAIFSDKFELVQDLLPKPRIAR